ncbi:MAG: hypothetical protein Ta2B_16940 [Termitinemataceae bacterium]|nr:MAG: hypothetical protein Ta2B_16940 [Termitinemataceae bacterium]
MKKHSLMVLVMSVLIMAFTLGAKAPFDQTEVQAKLMGIWVNQWAPDGVPIKYPALTISGNTFTYKWDKGSYGDMKWDGGLIEGTYSVTKNTIDFEASDGTKASAKYKFFDYGVYFEKNKDAAWFHLGDYFKIDLSNTLKKIDGTWTMGKSFKFVFSGTDFTYTKDKLTKTGTFEYNGKNLYLKVDGAVVRNFAVFSSENGTGLVLCNVNGGKKEAGDWDTYNRGRYIKQ